MYCKTKKKTQRFLPSL